MNRQASANSVAPYRKSGFSRSRPPARDQWDNSVPLPGPCGLSAAATLRNALLDTLSQPLGRAGPTWRAPAHRTPQSVEHSGSGRNLAETPAVARKAKKPPPTPEIVKKVLEYFLRHPQAADTLEGVARWRLPSQVIERTVDETNEAIQWLVQRGLLREHREPGTIPIFALDPSRKAEAEALLSAVQGRNR